MMQLNCTPHWEELYIRSYPLKDKSTYARKLIDLPVSATCSAGEASIELLLTYRRDLEENWRAFCAQRQLTKLRSFVEQHTSAQAVEATIASVFAQVETSCQQALQEMNRDLTRRDVLKRQLKNGRAQLLLQSNPDSDGNHLGFYHVGGGAIVAVKQTKDDNNLVLGDVAEASMAQWQHLAQALKQLQQDPRANTPVAMDAMLNRFMTQLLSPLQEAA